MKIDAFSMNLSSSRTHSETLTTEISTDFSFVNLMDNRLAEFSETTAREFFISSQSVSTMVQSSSWVIPVSLDGNQAVTMTDRFMSQLSGMRQIMDDVMSQFRQRMGGSGAFRITQVQQIYVLPVSQSSLVMDRAFEVNRYINTSYEESESLSVSADGVVQTADNREIEFSLDLSMDRQFFSEDEVVLTDTGYALIDPLVIQTDADAPLLSGGQFSFDLDMDGEAEDLPLPGAGYAFLALDLNGDGIINDGSELFGPSTGNGFAELADYDLDHNQWIDENDGIFDELVLWEQAEEGMTLTRLEDAGIGAIYLAGIPSRFDLTSEDNEVMGQVTHTSVALTEEGEAVAVHEVEYAVASDESIA